MAEAALAVVLVAVIVAWGWDNRRHAEERRLLVNRIVATNATEAAVLDRTSAEPPRPPLRRKRDEDDVRPVEQVGL